MSAGTSPQFDLAQFWQDQMSIATRFDGDFRNHPLPLARIKKVMKTDEDVKMISAEAPILFAKGCEMFIAELTQRAWIHAEENKRRTLQRSDIATAISKTDMCDFLIDIVPREEAVKASAGQPGKEAGEAYDTAAYAAYYQQSGIPYGTQLDPSYYQQMAQLTPEQLQQYQYSLSQHYAQHAQQQQGQDSSYSTTANVQQGSGSVVQDLPNSPHIDNLQEGDGERS